MPLHTDRKGTRHTWSRWWELLAKADPVALVHMVVPQLLVNCNDPNRLLNGALEDVWEEWHERVDPFLSGALRLTLDTPLHPEDIKQLDSLAKDPNVDNSAFRRLMTWLLARADERPVAYSYSNSDELISRDNEEVAKLNKVAKASNLPSVVVINEGVSVSKPSQGNDSSSRHQPSIAPGNAPPHKMFSPGLPGLSQVIRAWRSRPYDAQSQEWNVERFANIFGYRIIELAADNRHQEAISAIRLLSDGSGLGDREGILRSVAEGLERHGEIELAAFAYALTWTRTRGHGGWLTFGGETEINALHRATALNSEVACTTVAEEVERVVGTSGTYGISQALIYAFSVDALTCPGQSSLDLAFAAWDEAFAVIEARAPWVDASDDPDHPYLAPEQDGGEAAPGNLEAAVALATLGGLADPGREKKRRAFLAAQLLLDERPTIAAFAFQLALGTISDPATLTWLLRLIETSNDVSLPVRESCQDVFRELVSRDQITVRALARRLISGEQPSLVPPTPAHRALLVDSGNLLWTPENDDDTSPDDLDDLIKSVAGMRLQRSEKLLPGLWRAVRDRVETSLSENANKQRLKSQLDALGDRLRERWPDAFLVPEQTIEEALQSIATGGRTAHLINGNPIANPIAWEDKIAFTLLNDPIIPLTLEAHRQPRPHFDPPPGIGHDIWERIRKHAAGGLETSIEEVLEENSFIFATLTIESANFVSIFDGGRFKDWRWLGTVEKRLVKHPDWQHKTTDLVTKRYRVLEVRNKADRQALTVPPVAKGDLRMWQIETDSTFRRPLLNVSQPVVGEDRTLDMIGDVHRGLGVPDSMLVPTASLVALLNLHPGIPYSYEDKEGLALALVAWRAEYDTSDYYLARPRISGSGIVIRPDLFDRLTADVGADRLVLRDFVMGDIEFLSTLTMPTSNGS